MKLPSLRGRKDQEAMETQKQMAYVEHSKAGQEAFMDEYVQSVGKDIFSIKDENVLNLLNEQEMAYLVPLLSHLNRLTQITELDVELDRLDLEYNFLRLKCTMNEGDYDTEKAALIEALKFFANHIPTDARDGFKAKLRAYRMKIVRTELEEKKTKGLL